MHVIDFHYYLWIYHMIKHVYHFVTMSSLINYISDLNMCMQVSLRQYLHAITCIVHSTHSNCLIILLQLGFHVWLYHSSIILLLCMFTVSHLGFHTNHSTILLRRNCMHVYHYITYACIMLTWFNQYNYHLYISISSTFICKYIYHL